LIDIDESALEAAKAELGTPTIKATVNEALRVAGGRRKESVRYAFQTLADAPLLDRDDAWR
jgi:Arc/MetJ family transcription regulator